MTQEKDLFIKVKAPGYGWSEKVKIFSKDANQPAST